ncbi:MAG: hypothetical protein R2717_09720 [Schumannella sp.]
MQHAQPIPAGASSAGTRLTSSRDLELRDRAGAQASPPRAGRWPATRRSRLDPSLVAAELELGDPMPNSIDATASRDVVAEFAYIAAQLGVDLAIRRGRHPLGDSPRVRVRCGCTTPTRPGRASCRRRRTPTSPRLARAGQNA